MVVATGLAARAGVVRRAHLPGVALAGGAVRIGHCHEGPLVSLWNKCSTAHGCRIAGHGSRNVIIIGNQFSKNDLIAIALSPAAASRTAESAHDGQPAQPANVDGGHIVANNIISDFGYGNAHWMWKDSTVLPVGPTPLSIGQGQQPDDPPLRDVLVTSNVIYSTGRDGEIRNGQAVIAPPRYKYAVYLVTADQTKPGEPQGAMGVRFANNVFHPGSEGICNIDLPR